MRISEDVAIFEKRDLLSLLPAQCLGVCLSLRVQEVGGQAEAQMAFDREDEMALARHWMVAGVRSTVVWRDRDADDTSWDR